MLTSFMPYGIHVQHRLQCRAHVGGHVILEAYSLVDLVGRCIVFRIRPQSDLSSVENPVT